MVIARTIETTTHGRYLVAVPPIGSAAPLLVGFHGYAELAEQQLERMRAIPGADDWLIVSIQGLNRFYQRRTNDVIAGWMTRQDRELAIDDNRAYVTSVVEDVGREWAIGDAIVFAGFSQGVAMTFRAAAASPRRVAGVIAVGGDVPPELHAADLARLRSALVCRGVRDEWYTAEKFRTDVMRLQNAGADVRSIEYDGGHEWNGDVLRECAAFLSEVRR